MRTLHVITHRSWLAEDFAAVAGDSVLVAHGFGFDVPAGLLAPDAADALWAPMEWAARAMLAGAPLRLADPGPGFLLGLDPALLGRRVGLSTLDDLECDAPASAFFKPANHKVDGVEAGWMRRSTFAVLATAHGLPGDSQVLWADTLLDLVEEHRVFVRDGRVQTSSVYLRHHGDGAWSAWVPGMSSAHDAAARAFAAEAVEAAGSSCRAFVLDVALTGTGGWVVIEANPAWASNPYGCDMAAVLDTVLAASGVPAEAAWRPDSYLTARARAQRPLPSD